jgi:hypothetical protein
MAAIFPGGVKTFVAINPGDPILSSTENAQQEEIRAIEIELLKSSDSVVDHDALTNFVINEHIDHSNISINAGIGLTGGGDLTASRTISLSHLGLQNLTSPGADRVLFWDQSAGVLKWLTLGTGLAINDTTIGLSDPTIAQSLIYIQLFGKDENVVSVSAKTYVFVPSYLSGKKIKKIGMGLMTAGGSDTTVALDTYASISGNGFVESDNLNVDLPAVGTKIPINVTAGSGTPMGLDFWFVTGA